MSNHYLNDNDKKLRLQSFADSTAPLEQHWAHLAPLVAIWAEEWAHGEKLLLLGRRANLRSLIWTAFFPSTMFLEISTKILTPCEIFQQHIFVLNFVNITFNHETNKQWGYVRNSLGASDRIRAILAIELPYYLWCNQQLFLV